MRSRDELPAAFAELTRKNSDGEIVKMPENLAKLLEMAGLTPKKVLDLFRFMSLYWENYILYSESEDEEIHLWIPRFDSIMIEVRDIDEDGSSSIQINGVLERAFEYFEPWVNTHSFYGYYKRVLYAPLSDATINNLYYMRFDLDIVRAILNPLLQHYEELRDMHIDSEKLKKVFENGLRKHSQALETEYKRARSIGEDGKERFRKDSRYTKDLSGPISDLLHDKSFLSDMEQCYYVGEHA